MRVTVSLTYIFVVLLCCAGVDSILSKALFKTFVRKVASTFHENWRAHFLSEHPHTRNRFKLTRHGSHYNATDFIYPMILTVGSCLVHRNLKVARARFNASIIYVDILNMAYDELPEDWVQENRATAQVACRQVLRGLRQKRAFDRTLVEQVAERIHKAWLTRNAYRSTPDMLAPYADLPESEKDKDRRAFLIACRLFNELHLYNQTHTSPIRLIDVPAEL